MKRTIESEEELDAELDLGEALGASSSTSAQVLTLYIPNKDRDDQELPPGTQQEWVEKAAQLLARIGGGVTVLPPVKGGWLNPDTDTIVWENPILVYTYIKPEQFELLLPQLRNFVHRLGRETNQGEIAVEFDGYFFRITDYDEDYHESKEKTG